MRVSALFHVWGVLRRLVKDGGVSVETPFVHASCRGYFRTTLQLDGNLLIFLPDPARFYADPEGMAFYRTQARAHQQRVEQEIWRQLEAVRLLGQRAGESLGALAGVAGMAFWPWENIWWYLGGLLLAGLAGAALVHFILRPLLLAWLRRWLGNLL
jgi:hypothetical protein